MTDFAIQQFLLGAGAAAIPWALIIPIGLGVLFVMWAVGMYNSLVRKRNTVDESWADIETELKRRHNLIPNLVETVKGYAKHESETFENVIKARNTAASPHASPEAAAHDENVLSGALRQLFALAENYPDLKANTNFQQLQTELANTEDRVQRSRRFYNSNVRDFNNQVETFPSNMVAGMFSFEKREFFEIDDEAERQVPKVGF